MGTQAHTGRTPWDDGGRDWRDASEARGLPGVDSHHQERQGRMLPYRLQREQGPANTFILDL